MYFLWTIKFNFRRFLGRLSTNVIDTIAYTNSFWNQYFSVDQSDLICYISEHWTTARTLNMTINHKIP